MYIVLKSNYKTILAKRGEVGWPIHAGQPKDLMDLITLEETDSCCQEYCSIVRKSVQFYFLYTAGQELVLQNLIRLPEASQLEEDTVFSRPHLHDAMHWNNAVH